MGVPFPEKEGANERYPVFIESSRSRAVLHWTPLRRIVLLRQQRTKLRAYALAFSCAPQRHASQVWVIWERTSRQRVMVENQNPNANGPKTPRRQANDDYDEKSAAKTA